MNGNEGPSTTLLLALGAQGRGHYHLLALGAWATFFRQMPFLTEAPLCTRPHICPQALDPLQFKAVIVLTDNVDAASGGDLDGVHVRLYSVS